MTICSGTLLAARAGLLGSRRCTTHHELLPKLRALAPQAKVIDNRVFVVDGPLASSAGITAGIDIALHLIAEECGDGLAATVAEDMVVYLRRSDRDPEQSPFRMHRAHLHTTVHRVQDAIIDEPERTGTWRVPRGPGIRSDTCCGCSSRARVAPSISPGDQARAGEAGARVWGERTRAAGLPDFVPPFRCERAWGRHWEDRREMPEGRPRPPVPKRESRSGCRGHPGMLIRARMKPSDVKGVR